MPSNPPTRRSRRSSNGEPSLPIIPILIGVIVLGFVIGAGLSLAGRHDTVVALASPSASAVTATFAPVTPAPTEKPTPIPAPAQDATDAPRESAAPVTTAASRSTPRPKATRRATPAVGTARVTVAPDSAVSRTPLTAATEAPAAAIPATSATIASAAVAAGTSAPASNVEADSAFARLSAAVVRQYLEAVKRGDEDGAYAALGASPGSKGASLTEMGVVDSQTRVGRIDAHTAANDNALVSVQLQTPNGPYFGQYTVHKSDTGAAVIVAHSIVKP